MQYESYPALFRSADDASNKKQKTYLRLIGAEYTVLLLASVLSDSAFKGPTFYLLYAFVFVLAVVLLTYEKPLEATARLVQVSGPRRKREDAYVALHNARGTIRGWITAPSRTRRISKSVVQNFRREQSYCG